MTEPRGPEDRGPQGADGADGPDGPEREEVGDVGEEAAKLLGALSDWARDTARPVSGPGLGETLSGLADQAARTVSEINAHLATGSAECTWCPVCRTVHAVRQTSPEVRAHLTGAASSFLQAMVGLLATLPPPDAAARAGGAGSAVQRIDLDPDESDEPDDQDHLP